MNENLVVGWLAENIPLHLAWCKTFIPPEGMTRDQVIRIWVTWGLSNGLIGMFNKQSPVGYIMARPITPSRLRYEKNDYFNTLFEYDPQGQIAWIDTIWAPGHYREVLAWLRATRRRWVAWQHKNSYYLTEIASLSGDKPVRQQIRNALLLSG